MIKNTKKRELVKTIIDVGQRCWVKGWVASNDGNISCRLNDREILCTATGVSKGMLRREHVCRIDMEGNPLSRSKWKPSSEVKMHLKIYRERPEVLGVVHAHPPYATGHAIAGMPLNECVIPEIVVSLGSVPIVPYGTPSTDELPDQLGPYLLNYDAWLLENHGALACGGDIYQAFYKMEAVELFARMMFIARNLGNVNTLDGERVAALRSLRERFGVVDRDNIVCV